MEAVAARNHNKIQSALQDVSWKCKPRPTHSVRKILNSVLCQQSPDDEGHPVCGRSLLNSRPITKASDDLEALTPYHNLHISKKIIVACKTKRDLYIRMRWRKVRCVVTSVGSCVSSDRHARQSIMVQSQRKPHSWGTRHHYRWWSSRSSWMMSIVLEAKEDAKGPVCTFCSQTKHSILERPVTLVCLLVETTGYYWTGEWECCAVRYSVMLPTKKSQVRETWWRKHTWSMSLGMVLSCRSVPCSTIAAVGTRSGGSCSQTEPPLYVVLCPDWIKWKGIPYFFPPSVTARAGGGETLTKHSEITDWQRSTWKKQSTKQLIQINFSAFCFPMCQMKVLEKPMMIDHWSFHWETQFSVWSAVWLESWGPAQWQWWDW